MCCAVPCWDVLRDGQTAEDVQLSSKQLLLSLEGAVAQWSPPAPVRTDFPRQSVPVPVEPDADWPFNTRYRFERFSHVFLCAATYLGPQGGARGPSDVSVILEVPLVSLV